MVRAPRLDQRVWLIGVLHALAGEQIHYFERSFQALQIPPDAVHAAMPESVKTFCSEMLAFARDGDYAEGISAMLAAEWMYATWCSRAAKRSISDPELRSWVDLHAAPEFSAQAAWLRREIDAFGETASQRDVVTISTIFRRALELEIDFHSAPYETGRETGAPLACASTRSPPGARTLWRRCWPITRCPSSRPQQRRRPSPHYASSSCRVFLRFRRRSAEDACRRCGQLTSQTVTIT